MRRGQVLVKAPFLIIVFLGFGALAVDIGFVHYRKATVQSAAEATAFAAAWHVSTGFFSTYDANFPEVEVNAAQISALNAPGADAPVFEWGNWTRSLGFHVSTYSHLRNAVRVTVRARQRRFLGAFFSQEEKEVVGRCVVVWPSYGDVWPMTIASATAFTPNSTIALGPDSSNNAPGNKGWLGFDGDMNSVGVETYLDGGPYTETRPNPWDSTLALNQTPGADTTLDNGMTGTSIEMVGATGLMASMQDSIIAQIEAESIVFIPIWDSISGTGANTTYNICGLVPVQLVGPYTSLDNIQIRVLPEGAIWFNPNEQPLDTVKKHIKPELNIFMVE